MATPERRSKPPIRIEIPESVVVSNKNKCQRLLTSFIKDTLTYVKDEQAGSPRLLAFGDAARLLQADGQSMLADRDFYLPPRTHAERYIFIQAMTKKAAVEETQRSRIQDVKHYPGYESELLIISALIDKIAEPLSIAFLPKIDDRNEFSKDKAEADTQVLLGGILEEIVASPRGDFVFE
jgi:hypothetical protein